MADPIGAKPPFRELAEPIGTLTRRIVGRRGFPHALLFRQWPDIVGSEIAQYALPERIDYPLRRRTGGTLVVRVSSPSLALEIQHAAPAIIAAFNLHSGFAAIAALRLRHGPLPEVTATPSLAAPTPPDEASGFAPDATAIAEVDEAALSGIGDPELRDALQGLGRAIARRIAKG